MVKLATTSSRAAAVPTRCSGGGGNDQLNSDGSGDKLDGGAGIDTAYFKGALYGVHVDLEDGYLYTGYYQKPPAQGTPANIVDIEHVQGSNQADGIVGSAANNNIYGNGGDDHLYGGAGKDAINGGEGNDFINGGAGNNSLIGGLGDDTFVFAGDVAGAATSARNGQGFQAPVIITSSSTRRSSIASPTSRRT